MVARGSEPASHGVRARGVVPKRAPCLRAARASAREVPRSGAANLVASMRVGHYCPLPLHAPFRAHVRQEFHS